MLTSSGGGRGGSQVNRVCSLYLSPYDVQQAEVLGATKVAKNHHANVLCTRLQHFNPAATHLVRRSPRSFRANKNAA